MHLAYKLENVAFTLEGEETSACWHSFKIPNEFININAVFQTNNNIECNVLNMSLKTALRNYVYRMSFKGGKLFLLTL